MQREIAMTYRHTDDMGEISGFGGGYEQCCQDMLEAGVKWIMDRKPGADDVQVLVNPQVYGIIKEGNPLTEELSKAVIDASKGEATGAMHHAVMARLAFIAKNGWDAYCAKLRENEEKGSEA